MESAKGATEQLVCDCYFFVSYTIDVKLQWQKAGAKTKKYLESDFLSGAKGKNRVTPIF